MSPSAWAAPKRSWTHSCTCATSPPATPASTAASLSTWPTGSPSCSEADGAPAGLLGEPCQPAGRRVGGADDLGPREPPAQPPGRGHDGRLPAGVVDRLVLVVLPVELHEEA